MAAKKPVKKAAKPAPKAAKAPVKKPVAKKAVAKKAVAKKAASKAAPAKKPAAAKKPTPPAKPAKPAAKKVVAKKAAPAKQAPVKAAPVKSGTPAKKVVVAKQAAPAKKPVPAKKEVAIKKAAPAPAAKPASSGKSAKTGRSGKSSKHAAAQPKAVVVSSAQNAPRKPGKVAVAVVGRPSVPVPKGKFKVVPYRTDVTNGRPIVPNGYKPGADEEYMSVLQLEYFRQRLLSWRGDLVEESKQTIENLKDEVRDVGDEAERATRETENSLELRTRDRYRKLIGKIDSTLKRLDNGDYGYCVDTGEDIGLDRMEARLTAERTIDAQERWEHMQRQMGD
ncbi:RNA polymerase-binding protein DksA [Thermomonas sp.]|uniref:RNA polymerase-binding protein DksA n=1 Tax=Thermomonas sp. TaxID=1971895 RepID=UPI00248900CA|nr:RNA polymerase-binding protein DksA [Thermomonas sp.]MDI1252906.1 RNA polymerase-binding protein DksA [Thermomonas sp.]